MATPTTPSADGQPPILPTKDESDSDSGSSVEVELHPETYKDSRPILVDKASKKVYAHDEDQGFLGKLLENGDIDFTAVDSSDEEDDDDENEGNGDKEVEKEGRGEQVEQKEEVKVEEEKQKEGPEIVAAQGLQEEKKEDDTDLSQAAIAPSTPPARKQISVQDLQLEKEKLLQEQQALQSEVNASTTEEEQLLAELQRLKDENEILKAKVSEIKTKTTPGLKSELETNKSSLEEIQKKLLFEEQEVRPPVIHLSPSLPPNS